MLLELKITNFKSIKEQQTLSMLTSSRVKTRYNEAVVVNDVEILKTSVILGKNNGGKSNILDAFKVLKDIVKGELYEKNSSFQFDIQTINEPSILELDFVYADNRYIYYVEFKDKLILKEFVFLNNMRKSLLITRDGSIIKYSNNYKSTRLKKVFDHQSIITEDSEVYKFIIDKVCIYNNEKCLSSFRELYKKHINKLSYIIRAFDTGILEMELDSDNKILCIVRNFNKEEELKTIRVSLDFQSYKSKKLIRFLAF
jgi:predicted ATP-dependent endonuclease of OLD family